MTAAVLLQTANAEDVFQKVSDKLELTGPQAAARLTAAVNGVWIGGLGTLTSIACAKQATDPVTWICDHKGTTRVEFTVYRVARKQAQADPLRKVKMFHRVPGTSLVDATQDIRAIHTPAEMAARYSVAAAGIWRGTIGEITGVQMDKNSTVGAEKPYALTFFGVVATDEDAFLDAFEAGENDAGQTCEDIADVVEE